MATIRERLRKDGKPVFNVQIRIGGYGSQTRSFRSKSEAQKWAKVEEGKVYEGRAFRGAEAHRRTLGDAIDQYVTEKLPCLRSQGMHSAALDWWKSRLGKRKLIDVTAAVIVRERAALLREKYSRANPDSKRTSLEQGEAANEFTRTTSTANRYLAVLSSCLSATRREWHWLQHNPCEEIEKLPERPNRARVLTPAERKALLAETIKNPTLHLFVQTALHTCARAGELLKLEWRDVDLDAGQLIFRDTKNEQPRSAWLHGDVAKLMTEHAKRDHEPGDRVFQNASKRGRYQYADAFQSACTAAGLGKFHFHNLRHTAATTLAQLGASEQQLKAVGGWKSGIVSRYIHIAAADTRAITKKLSKQL